MHTCSAFSNGVEKPLFPKFELMESEFFVSDRCNYIGTV